MAPGRSGAPGGNVTLLGGTLFAVALGEELWQTYLPKYLAVLGANGVAIGAFSSLRDLLDGAYQYPGGWLVDRFGQRRALLAGLSLALAGYVGYATAGRWPLMFVALAAVMAWRAGAFPLTFAVLAEELPAGRRTFAFSVQSILVRIPRVIGAPAGGLLIGSFGLAAGFRAAALFCVIVTAGVLVLNWQRFRETAGLDRTFHPRSIREVVTGLPRPLTRLLLADAFVRFGEAIGGAFIILYSTTVIGISTPAFGVLYAIQQTVAILSYVPTLRSSAWARRRVLIAFTFVAFALFPLAVRVAGGLVALVAAFVIGGLKELGEPARKSLIADLAPAAERGRAVGAYYTIRNTVIVPAGVIGGILWQGAPARPLEVGCVVSVIGVCVFLATFRSE